MGCLTALKLDIKDGIGVITFDQPGSRANTLGQVVLGEFEQLLAELKRRTDLRGLVLQSGKPGMFIAGADLRELGAVGMDRIGLVVSRCRVSITRAIALCPMGSLV